MTSENDKLPPVISIPTTRILRSPSHESVTTELSLLSVSSLASDMSKLSLLRMNFKSYSEAQLHRGPSPNPDSSRNRLAVPGETTIPEIWFEEENDLIKSCGALSSVLGIQKSFSTSDITQLDTNDLSAIRPSVSEVILCGSKMELPQNRLDHTSRSCSTWVAIGDISSTSQLPSPQGRPGNAGDAPAFTAADFIRSVNKKVRQNYIRRRLLTTYKALERLSQSEFDLDRLEQVASNAETESGPTLHIPQTQDIISAFRSDFNPTAICHKTDKHFSLTVKDVEREKGKPLSKYERNMMIFNWLHTLDEDPLDGLQ